MAKPVRLNDTLVEDAERQGALAHRSAPKQVEYWAAIGKIVAEKMRPSDMLALLQGFLDVKLVASNPSDFDMDDIMESLEADRASGRLANTVSGSAFRYGINPDNPKQLIRIDARGTHPLDPANLIRRVE